MRKAPLCILLLLLVGLGAQAQPAPVSAQDQQAVRALLRQLYDAYKARDLNLVLGIIGPAIDASAAQVEKSGKGTAQEVKDAFKGFHEDLFAHPDYRLQDFDDQYLVFECRPDGSILVTSPVPVILSDSLQFKNSDGSVTPPIRLRLGQFVLRQVDGRMRLVEMQL